MSQDSDIEMLKARVEQLEGLVHTLMTKYGGISDPSRMVGSPVFQGPVTVSVGNVAIIINGVFNTNQSSGIALINLTTGEQITIDPTTLTAFGPTSTGGFAGVAVGTDGAGNGIIQVREASVGQTNIILNGFTGEVLGLTLTATDFLGTHRVTVKGTISGTASSGGGALPAQVRGYLVFEVNNVTKKVPYYDN